MTTKTKPLSKAQQKALDDIYKYGDAIGKMVGSVSWELRWENPKIPVKPPAFVTIRALINRYFVYQARHCNYPVYGELRFTVAEDAYYHVYDHLPDPYYRPHAPGFGPIRRGSIARVK